MVVDFRSMHFRREKEGYRKISENILLRFFPNDYRLRRKHQIHLVIFMEKAKTALASEAALTTKEGLVYEPGDAQKIKDHSGYHT